MTQSDHEAAKSGESGKERGVFFVASKEPAMVAKPGDGAFNDPALAVTAQRTAILGGQSRLSATNPARTGFSLT